MAEAEDRIPDTKTCLRCQKRYERKAGTRMKQWVRQRYCSRSCAISARHTREGRERYAASHDRRGHILIGDTE